MLPVHHLLQLVPNRAKATLDRIQAGIWTHVGVPSCEATATTEAYIPWWRARQLPRKLISRAHVWGRLFDQRWVRVQLSNKRTKTPLYLEWHDQGEATLYVEREPYYGFDVAHRRVALPKDLREVWIECMCCQSAIWHPAATGLSPDVSRGEGAALLTRDDEAWQGFREFQATFDL